MAAHQWIPRIARRMDMAIAARGLQPVGQFWVDAAGAEHGGEAAASGLEAAGHARHDQFMDHAGFPSPLGVAAAGCADAGFGR